MEAGLENLGHTHTQKKKTWDTIAEADSKKMPYGMETFMISVISGWMINQHTIAFNLHLIHLRGKGRKQTKGQKHTLRSADSLAIRLQQPRLSQVEARSPTDLPEP